MGKVAVTGVLVSFFFDQSDGHTSLCSVSFNFIEIVDLQYRASFRCTASSDSDTHTFIVFFTFSSHYR